MVKKQSTIEDYKYSAIVIGTSIVAAIAIGLIAGKPLFASLSKTSKELKEKKETLIALETKLETLKGLKDKEAELKQKNQKVLAALPEDKDVSRLFVQFEKVAQASGINIKQVTEQTQSTTQTTDIKEVQYQLTASATNYAGFKQALEKLNEALRILSVSNVSLNKTASSLDVVLDVITYTRGTK